MSMSDLNAPVSGERRGYGTTVGPTPYVPGAGAGFLIAVNQVNYINRVISARERSGSLLVCVSPVVVGDRGNQVRVRAYYPHHSHLQAEVRTSLRAAAIPPADHPAVDIQNAVAVSNHAAAGVQTALGIAAHAHAFISQGMAAPPTVPMGWDVAFTQLTDAGAAALHTFAGGAATGVQNATNAYGAGAPLVHAYGAGAPVTHAAWDGIAATAVAVGEEVTAIDLAGYTFDVEVAGF
jgi:hypothetical protein